MSSGWRDNCLKVLGEYIATQQSMSISSQPSTRPSLGFLKYRSSVPTCTTLFQLWSTLVRLGALRLYVGAPPVPYYLLFLERRRRARPTYASGAVGEECRPSVVSSITRPFRQSGRKTEPTDARGELCSVSTERVGMGVGDLGLPDVFGP